MTQFKCDHLNQKEKIDRFSPQFFTPLTNQIKTMQDLMNYPYFFFIPIRTKQVSLTPVSPTPVLS